MRGRPSSVWVGCRTRSIAALDDLIAHDRDWNIQRRAVEALGRLPGELTMSRLSAIARSHPDTEVRRQAIEVLGRQDPDKALPVLEDIIKRGINRAPMQ